ncbi:hypothetical protein ATN79_46990 [Paraburkholderia caribensis]|nr:hypothetical protein ATN79_46990 [Paraburkholderia caribensis]
MQKLLIRLRDIEVNVLQDTRQESLSFCVEAMQIRTVDADPCFSVKMLVHGTGDRILQRINRFPD